MKNVISFEAAKKIREAEREDMAYQSKILSMDKLQLLDEMVRFQEERSRLGHLTLPMMVQGKYLFRALEQSAETEELKILTRTYRRHLEHELASYLESKRTGNAE